MLLLLAQIATAACPTPNPNITVCPGGLCNYTSIAVAINAAAANNVICVDPGTYTDQLFLSGRRVRVETSAWGVIIQTGSSSELIRIESNGDLELQGVDINGNANRRCAYVTGSGSSLRLEGSDMSGCTQATDGAGIYLDSNTSATITDSTLVNNGSGNNSGGNIFANNATSLDIIRTVISGGRANSGGALRLVGGTHALDDVTLVNNTVDSGRGGHIWQTGGSLTITDGSFTTGDSTAEGGCVAVESSVNLDIFGTTFDSCVADGDGGAIYASTGSVEIYGAAFYDNIADVNLNNGGDGGGLYGTGATAITITDTIFDGNYGDVAGGLFTTGTGNVDLLRNEFCQNDADANAGGAGLYGLTSSGIIANNIFQRNTCGGDGGGLYLNGASSLTVRHNTFVENDCPGGGNDGDAVFFQDGQNFFNNNIVGYHVDEGVRRSGGGGSNLTSAYNLWYQNGTDVQGFSKGAGEITGDNPDFHTWSADNTCNDAFLLQGVSPAVNTGDPNAALNDLDGSRSDMGAYGGPTARDPDADNDGSLFVDDCDDNNPNAYPGATEGVGDGFDGDCNGTESCYQDTDGDGFGNNTVVQSATLSCIGAGISRFNTDCAPANASRYPGATEIVANGIDENCDLLEHCYQDIDDDNYGTAVIVTDADLNCTDDPNQANVNTDCNDNNAAVNPGAVEIVANGVDNNCDTLELCYVDTDTDTYGGAGTTTSAVLTCLAAGVANNNTDCNNNNAAVNPGATEIVANGIDENCNGGDVCWLDTDNDTYGHPTTTTLSADLDCADLGEAAVNTDCNNNNAAIHPGAVELIANGIDEDCNGGDTCYRDNDGDGVAGTTFTIVSADLDCTDPGEFSSGTDCNDSDPNRYPGNNEVVGNGVDEDCDGVESCYIDLDGDSFGTVITDSNDLDCIDVGEAVVGGDCNDNNNAIHPNALETIANGVDQNCDGRELCYADSDRDGYGQNNTLTSTVLSCVALGVSPNNLDCNDGLATVYPGAVEVVANGIDESCDGAEVCWRDADLDGFGTTLATQSNGDLDCLDANESLFSTDCNDANAAISPAAVEITNNGIDENCDTFERCYQDLDNDTYGRATTANSTVLSCNGPGVANDTLDCNDNLSTVYPGAVEIVGDGIDQDCSGTDTITCFRDNDQDGYGSTTSILATDGICDFVQRESAVNTDCNDAVASIHPLATEIRGDGIDQDCDGFDLIDCYLDVDNDGFGQPTIVSFSGDCGPAANKSDNAADCNDNDINTYPGAPDVCGDGIDNDCNGAFDDDGDGLDFDEEQGLGTDDCNADSDFDLANDLAEVLAGTDPLDPDSDGDTLLDGLEFGGVTPLDTDGDGIIDPLDTDDDNDLVPTQYEVTVGGGDFDSDGIANHVDDDDDDDYILTRLEDVDGNGDPRNDDTDGDGNANWVDTDDDNDGVLTRSEVLIGADPLAIDSDGDGVPDGIEWGLGGTARDTDGDGQPDIIDTDDDNDNIDTVIEGLGDPDGDSVPNYLDDDSDGDGKLDIVEGSVNDSDLDGQPDWLDYNDSDGEAGDVDQDGLLTRDEILLGTTTNDPDTDGDGVPDGLEVGNVLMPLDSDGDGILDVFDEDDENDWVHTRLETGVQCPDGSAYTISFDVFGLVVTCLDGSRIPTPLVYKDTDTDGVPNYLDPDDDGDGLLTRNEDTDGDGDWFNDDFDGDGVPDFDDRYGQDGPNGDQDGDGLSNTEEELLGSNPFSPDTDGDGIFDGDEAPGDSDNDGLRDFEDDDDDGDGVPTREEGRYDTDGDGIPDYLDTDSDGDGVADGAEADGDTDCDGLPNRVDAFDGPPCDGGPVGRGLNYVRQGCGCDAAPAGAAPWLFLALLGLAARRRRVVSQSP